ncbi:MAG TPA: hypothetical protein DCS63_06465, partial [Elusimicrobia bacterium]|nr:hypothetical protein [Elusimicrobiota bacterium]
MSYGDASLRGDNLTGTAQVYKHVSIGVAKADPANGFNNDQLYMVFVSSQGHIHSLTCASTTTASAANWTTQTEIANTIDTPLHPSLAYSVTRPYPIPLVWQDSGGVNFDKIATSGWGAVDVTAVSTISVGGVIEYLQTSTFTLVVTATNLTNYLNTTPIPFTLKNLATTTNVSVSSYIYTTGKTTMTAIVEISAPTGYYDIKVVNPDGKFDIYPNAFRIEPPAITAVSSKTAGEYLTSSTYTYVVRGGYFQNWVNVGQKPSATVLYNTLPTSDVTAESLVYVSSAELNVIVKISSTAAINGGPYDIKITNPDGQSVTAQDVFAVPKSSITAAYEQTQQNYLTAQTYNFVLKGNDFQKWTNISPSTWTTVQFIKFDEAVPTPNITVNNTVFVSPQELTVNITLNPSAGFASGPYKVKVINPDGQYSVLPDTYTILPPVFDSVSDSDGPPTSGGQNAGVLSGGTLYPPRNLTIRGSNFQNWSATKVSSITVLSATGITVSSITYQTSGRFIASLIITTNAAGVARDIRVYNPDGQASTLGLWPSTFTITAPTATLTYPLAGYTTGFASVNGGAGFNNIGQTSLLTGQIRITALNKAANGVTNVAGLTWDGGGGWETAVPAESAWKSVTGASVWNYLNFVNANQAQDQTEGQQYKIDVRGVTQDQGKGIETSGTVTLDRRSPEGLILLPDAVALGAQKNIQFRFTDNNGGTADMLGVGISTGQIIIMDTLNTLSTADDFAWTGSTWSDIPGAEIWLSTDSADTSTMQFGPGKNSASYVTIASPIMTDVTLLPRPIWLNGKKYRIKARAFDALGNNSYTSESQFIYDNTPPTVTLSLPTPLVDSAVFTDMPWQRGVTQISGTMEDYGDALNEYSVYVRIADQGALGGGPVKYLNPASDVFDGTLSADAWKKLTLTGAAAIRAWTRSTASVGWLNNHSYKVEVYAVDMAGNSAGLPGTPLYVKYFRFDNDVPTQGITYPINGGNYGVAPLTALSSLTTFYGTSADDTSGVDYVEYKLEDPSGDKWHQYVSSGEWLTSAVWNVARTTTTTPYDTWLSTGVAWLNGEQFTLIVKSKDKAGNYSAVYSTYVFKYDISAPNTTVLVPTEGLTYSQPFSTVNGVRGNILDIPENSGREAGLQEFYVGIKSQRTGLWWNGTVLGWQSVRADKWHSPPAGTAWTHQSLGGFWTSYNSDTFEVYAWGRDNVDQPDASYRNIESSMTLKHTFKFETEKPSTTLNIPVDGQWYSSVSGYDLAQIGGTAWDLPLSGPGSGGSVTNVKFQIRRGSNDTQCWGGADYNTNCSLPESWFNRTSVTDSTSTMDMTGASGPWAKTTDGETYRVRMKAYDSALDANDSPYPNEETYFDTAGRRNEKTFRVDRVAPTALIQAPNIPDVYTFDSVSGNAQDSLTQVKRVQVAYFRVSAPSAWWNPASVGTFDQGDGVLPPPENAFVEASTNTDNPVLWSVTGSSVPLLENGKTYLVFARATDVLGNKTAFPGYVGYTIPPIQSALIKINKVTPLPDSTISVPAGGAPYFRPTDLNAISGTLAAANTVQIMITNVTAEPDQVWTPGGWVSTVTYLVGCTDQSYEVGKSSCGYFGVDSAGAVDWSKNVTGIWPVGTNQFSVKSRAASDATLESSLPPARYFYIDGNDPASTLVEPNAQYERSVPSIYGTATDTGEGKVDKVEVLISTTAQTSYWDGDSWETSATWLPISAVDGTFDSSLEPWSLSAGLPVFQNGRTYEVQLRITDKAGRIKYYPEPYQQFTIDTSSPAARIAFPAASAALNNVPQVSGTASDPGGKNEGVQIAIQQWGGLQKWYNGDVFVAVADPIWIELKGNTSGYLSATAEDWSYSPVPMNDDFTGGLKYMLLTRSTDVAGNQQTQFDVPASSRVFYVDKYPPATTVTRPEDYGDYLTGQTGRYNSANIGKTDSYFYGSAADTFYAANNAGVEKSRIRLSYLLNNDTYYWLTTAVVFSSGTAAELVSWQDTDWVAGWFYTEIVNWPAGDREYKLEAKSMDATRAAGGGGEGNWETAVTAGNVKRFIIDDTPPSVAITGPLELSLTAPTSITGTADAAIAGFQKTQVRISTGTGVDTRYWSGSAWVTEPETWIDSVKDGPTAWSYAISNTLLVDKATCTVNARALDYAGNYSTTYSTRAFLNQRPASSIAVPLPTAYNTLTSLSGSARDNAAVSEVQISIFNYDQGICYDPSQPGAWVDPGCSTDNDAPWVAPQITFLGDAATWTYAVQDSTWTSGAHYRVRARSRDAAGNWDVVYATVAFQFDAWTMFAPASAVTYPADGAHLALSAKPVTILGSSSDDYSGVSKVEFYLRKFNGEYWNGIGWQGPAVTLNGDAPLATWSKLVSNDAAYIDSERYTLTTWATDVAGNAEAPAVKSTFVYDISRPTNSITYPYNGGYIAKTGKITGGSYDKPYGITGDVNVRIKQLTGPKANHYWRVADSSWTVENAPQVWNSVISSGTLSANATWWQLGTTPWQTLETYEINSYALDKAGNAELVYSTVTNIAADFTAPRSTITLPADGLTYGETPLPQVTGTAHDDSPGEIEHVYLQFGYTSSVQGGTILWSYDGSAWQNNAATWLPVSSVTLVGDNWTYDMPDTIWQWNNSWYSLRAYAKDKAANTETTLWRINFMYSAPYPNTWVNAPANNSYTKTKPQTISGGATKFTYPNASSVKVSVERKSDGYYWYGSTFSAPGSLEAAPRVYINASNVSVLGDSSLYWEWTENISTSAWTDNTSYYFLTKGYGPAGEEQGADLVGNTVVYDITPPNAAISAPAPLIYKSVTQVSGNASDTVPGLLDKSDITIQDLAYPTTYWNPVSTAWQNGIVWATTTLTAGNWALNTGLPAWTDGANYRITPRATDRAANVQTGAAVDFLVDRTTPTAKITDFTAVDSTVTAASGQFRSSLDSLIGTAWDTAGAGGTSGKLDKVLVHIKRPAQGADSLRYWKWTTRAWDAAQAEEAEIYWGTSTVHIPGVSVSSWTHSVLPPFAAFTQGGTYILRARAADTALPQGNTQQIFTLGESSFTFIWDSLPPSAAVTGYEDTGGNGAVNPAGPWTISGSASDSPAGMTGVASLRLQLSRLEGQTTYYWTGLAWSGTVSEFEPDSFVPPNWDYVLAAANMVSDQKYMLKIRGIDNAVPANAGSFGAAIDVKIDTTPPTVEITSPTPVALKALSQISGTAYADIAGHKWTELRITTTGVDGMRYWNSASSVWQPGDYPIITSKTGGTSWYYTVPAAMLKDDVVYTATARALDYAGNYSVVYSTYIFTYDITPVGITLASPLDGVAYSGLFVSTPAGGVVSNTQFSANTGISTVAVQVTDLD